MPRLFCDGAEEMYIILEKTHFGFLIKGVTKDETVADEADQYIRILGDGWSKDDSLWI